MNRPVTQKELAEVLGLSRMAVSLALRDSLRVSADTRARVKAEAERLGYRPDPGLRALTRYRMAGEPSAFKEMLAFVTSWKESDTWRKEYVYRFFQGASRAAEAGGYRLEPFWLGEYRTAAIASSVLVSRGIRGLLLAPLEQPGALNLDWKNFATVAVGTTVTEPAADRVRHDYENSIRLALTELTARGYRRIALVLSPRVDQITEQRVRDAFTGVTRRIPMLRRCVVCLSGDETKATFLNEIRRVNPDCILSLHDRHKDWLKSGGSRVPDEIGFAGLHVKAEGSGLSGIDYGAELIGATAVDRLDTLLQRNALGLPKRPVTILIPGRWIAGETVRSIKSGSAAPHA